MMSRRFAGCVVRLAVLPSCAAQPASLLDITPSLKFNPLGQALSVRRPSARRLDRRPVCLPLHPCVLRTDSTNDAYLELIRASLGK